MPQKEMMSAICSQLLTPDDINISEELISKIDQEKIIVQVLITDDSAAIRIYSQQALMLSLIMPILHHFGFNIIDEVAFSFSQVLHFDLHLINHFFNK